MARLLRRTALIVTTLVAVRAAHAGNPLPGIGTCTLTLSSSGKLAMAGDGQTLSTQATGGLPATMAIVGVNLTPQLIFSPLSVMGPTGWSASPTAYLAVSSLSGKTQPFTTSSFAITPGILIDTLTMDAKIVSTTGFKAGSYSASGMITCQSA